MQTPEAGNFILVHFVNDQPVGYQFERRRLQWPLHITLIVWFSLPQHINRVILDEKLQETGRRHKAFNIQIGPVEYFGPNKDIPVNTIVNQKPVRELHNNLKQALDEMGVSYQSERWMGNSFTAHITQHGDKKAENGSSLLVQHFHLVELLPKNLCRVGRRYHLGYNS